MSRTIRMTAVLPRERINPVLEARIKKLERQLKDAVKDAATTDFVLEDLDRVISLVDRRVDDLEGRMDELEDFSEKADRAHEIADALNEVGAILRRV